MFYWIIVKIYGRRLLRWFKAMAFLKRAELYVSLGILGACDLNACIDQFKFSP